ncbi:MAG: hypothetical protein QXP07_03440, partial [Candidatus Parvarchaeum sp.]|nr:hypothetical protein [Candidatus Parvarchaeum tengchongense]
AALDRAIKVLESKSESILALDNLKTISGTAKIINYISLYNEVKSMSASYQSKEDEPGKNWVFYLISHNR